MTGCRGNSCRGLKLVGWGAAYATRRASPLPHNSVLRAAKGDAMLFLCYTCCFFWFFLPVFAFPIILLHSHMPRTSILQEIKQLEMQPWPNFQPFASLSSSL